MNFSPERPIHLSVSIVLHNSDLNLLRGALASLRASAQAAREAGYVERIAVMLVDNASGAGYRARLAELIRDWPASDGLTLQCECLPGNRGFGHGHNTAIGRLSSDVHLVLNPDVELRTDTLCAGLDLIIHSPDIVLVSPKVYGGGGEQEFLCKRYPSVLVLLLRGFAPGFVQRWFRRRLDVYEMRDVCSGEERVDVGIASGCFMLMRTAVLQAEGGFNEDFFLYFEDFDLSLRLEHRGRLVFDPAVCIVHHGGYAARKGWEHTRYFLTSGLLFFNRHGWRWI